MTTRFRRSELLSLLSEACELEHALACSYLFAAFSIKQGPEDGLDWQQAHLCREWAAQVYFVASQEMLHLAQAWNLLSAIGGTPYYDHERFPHPKGYYPVHADLSLGRYDAATLNRFIVWETPRQRSTRASGRFATIGELYDRIHEGFQAIDVSELFVGDPGLQIDRTVADFPDLIPVRDRESAAAAIASIQHQGEGTVVDHMDCHFGMFTKLRQALTTCGFEPGRAVLSNPATLAGPGRTLVTKPAVQNAMDLFDDIYALMLRVLAWVFGPGDPKSGATRALARFAIATMPVILKPLGEALTTLKVTGGRAGAAFDLHRHVQLPVNPALAATLVRERLNEVMADAAVLARELPEIRWVSTRLGQLGGSI